MNARRHTKFVREGSYAAEVDVELIEEENGWSPYLSLDDARKLDDVREALRRGDFKAASRLARVFCLPPIPRLTGGRTSACAGWGASPNEVGGQDVSTAAPSGFGKREPGGKNPPQ